MMELVIEHKDKNIEFCTLPKYVRCGLAKINTSNWRYEEHLHLDYELVYIKKGTLKYYINNREFIAEAGDVYFIQPKQTHKEISLSEDLEYYFIEYYFLNLKGKVEYIAKEEGTKQYLSKAPADFERLFEKIYEEEHGEKSQQFIEAMLLYMIELLKKHLNINENIIKDVVKDKIQIVNKIVKFIEKSRYEDINLSNLSKYCCISPDYLSHIFKEITGSSVLKYAVAVKGKEAKELILNTNRSIKDISEELGFKNPYHFSRVFKKAVGISPQNLKKQKCI